MPIKFEVTSMTEDKTGNIVAYVEAYDDVIDKSIEGYVVDYLNDTEFKRLVIEKAKSLVKRNKRLDAAKIRAQAVLDLLTEDIISRGK